MIKIDEDQYEKFLNYLIQDRLNCLHMTKHEFKALPEMVKIFQRRANAIKRDIAKLEEARFKSEDIKDD